MIKIYKYGEVSNDEVFARGEAKYDVEGAVSDIIANVRKNGDEALREYSLKFDKVELRAIEVTREEIEAAYASVEAEFIDVIERAAKNIYAFHSRQVRNSFVINDKDGIVMGQKILPIEKVGLYVPGGTAAYPSSVLMNCIPAKIAGCSEIVMVSPPTCNGEINPVILAAAKVAGVDRVFRVGGAQAVAALAYGTESVPKVDKIVGPGNAFVAEAKKQVFG
jgi:histidinol dehydrogenase